MLKNVQFRVESELKTKAGLLFSKNEIRELLHTLKQIKSGEGAAGPFKNSKAILDYLHSEGNRVVIV